LYSTVSVEISGNTPSEKIIQKGIPMVYGVTIPKNSPNRVAALAFLDFMLSKDRGMAILEKLGQPSVIPSSTGSYRNIPDELKKYAKQQK
jgi:molybdate/tungstate transport system substrate-binding protein